MVELNIPNALTIGIISVAALMLYKFLGPKIGAPAL